MFVIESLLGIKTLKNIHQHGLPNDKGQRLRASFESEK